MKKKDLIVIGVIVVFALVALLGMKFMNANNTGDKTGLVVYKSDILFYFDVDKDATYEFTGDYGKMHLEVKDGSFRVYDVECPNQICVNMGWLHKDDLYAQVGITCLPNNIAVICESGE